MAAQDELFGRAMRGVEPLGDESKRVRQRREGRRESAAANEPSRPRFEFDTWGDHHQGLAHGVDDQELRRLEAGDYPPELHLDLHGLGEVDARELVRRSLSRATRGGLRCVRIVHGRGLRSPAGPVLKAALPEWLAEPPHGKSVLAFTSAGSHGGGGGATLVLLRRRR